MSLQPPSVSHWASNLTSDSANFRSKGNCKFPPFRVNQKGGEQLVAYRTRKSSSQKSAPARLAFGEGTLSAIPAIGRLDRTPAPGLPGADKVLLAEMMLLAGCWILRVGRSVIPCMCLIPFGPGNANARGRSAEGRHIQLRAVGAARSGGSSAAKLQRKLRLRRGLRPSIGASRRAHQENRPLRPFFSSLIVRLSQRQQ